MAVCIGVHCWKDGCRECTHHSDSLRYSFLAWRSHAAVVCVSLSCLNEYVQMSMVIWVQILFLEVSSHGIACQLLSWWLNNQECHWTWSAKALLWTLVACCTIYRYWDMAQLRWVLMFHHLLAAAGVDEDSSCQQLMAQVVDWVPCCRPSDVCFCYTASFQVLSGTNRLI